MIAHTRDDFEQVRRILVEHRGRANAITIDQLCHLADLPSRRACEDLLETRLADFQFILVADAHGYYIPTTADEINHYLDSLQSRAVKIFLRKRRVMRKALASGLQRQGKHFSDPPALQKELPLVCI